MDWTSIKFIASPVKEREECMARNRRGEVWRREEKKLRGKRKRKIER